MRRSDLQMLTILTPKTKFQRFSFGTVNSCHFISINKINFEIEEAANHDKLNFCLFTFPSNTYILFNTVKGEVNILCQGSDKCEISKLRRLLSF